MDPKEFGYEALLVLFLMLFCIRLYFGLGGRKKGGLKSGPAFQVNVPQTPALESERHRLRSRLRELDQSIPSLEREIAELTTIAEGSVETRQLFRLKIDERNATLDRLRGYREMVKETIGHIDA